MQTQRDINDYQAFYDNSPFEAEAAFRTRKHVLGQLSATKAKRILEVGCANVALFLDLSENDFDIFVVAEPSPIFAERAKKQITNADKIFVLNDFVENLTAQLVDFQFDTIVVSGLLHEVEHPSFIMESLAKCCNADTKILVNVPNAHSFHRLLAYEMGMIPSITTLSDNQLHLQQHHTFSKASLVALCEAAGFDVVEQSTYFIKPFTHLQMAELIKNPTFPPQLLDGMENMIKYMPDLGAHISLILKKK